MFGLLVLIFVGLIVATIAKALLPGPDPGVGITVLLGTAGVVLLYSYRETGLEERMARPSVNAPPPPDTDTPTRDARRTEPLWHRVVARQGERRSER